MTVLMHAINQHFSVVTFPLNDTKTLKTMAAQNNHIAVVISSHGIDGYN